MAWSAGDDIWRLMFELANQAARTAEESDLVPHWMVPGEHRVERHVPQPPYTAEVEAFDRLKRQLAAYRVVFGQPRQRSWLRCSIALASMWRGSGIGRWISRCRCDAVLPRTLSGVLRVDEPERRAWAGFERRPKASRQRDTDVLGQGPFAEPMPQDFPVRRSCVSESEHSLFDYHSLVRFAHFGDRQLRLNVSE